MPTTCSEKKSTVAHKKSANNANNSARNLVATVNKSPNGRKMKVKTAISGKKLAGYQAKELGETAKKSKIDKIRSVSPQPSSSLKVRKGKLMKDPKVTTATFSEDQRNIFMSVEEGEEELDYHDDATEVSEDQEISLRASQNSSHADEKEDTSSESESEQEDTQTDDQDSQDTTDQCMSRSECGEGPSDTRARTPTVEEIDLQVQEKIRELELLVNQRGLKGSAALLNESLGKESQSIHRNCDLLNQNREGECDRTENTNNNLSSSISDHTIYDRVVKEKRVSSSSEEITDPDTSDDMLQIQFDKMQVLQGVTVIPDTGRVRQHQTDGRG